MNDHDGRYEEVMLEMRPKHRRVPKTQNIDPSRRSTYDVSLCLYRIRSVSPVTASRVAGT